MNSSALFETIIHVVRTRTPFPENTHTRTMHRPNMQPRTQNEGWFCTSKHHPIRTPFELDQQKRYLLPSTPMMPPALPCILVGTLSLNPLKLSLDESVLVALFLGLRLRKLLASFSSHASFASTLGPPSFWSSRICCREPAAWSSAFPAGG